VRQHFDNKKLSGQALFGVFLQAFPHHVLGHKEKEDVLCPKCHKVVCSTKTNGFFKTELIEN
jgi:hypothetical protein